MNQKELEDLLHALIKEFKLQLLQVFLGKKNEFFRPDNLSSADFSFLLKEYSEYSKNFEDVKRVGVINTEKLRLVFVAIKTISDLTERFSKKKQYSFAKHLLKDTRINPFWAEGGIFVFYDRMGRFRFSFVFSVVKKEKRRWNNFKRYTYFVDRTRPNRTFIKALLQTNFESLEEIEKAFSIAPLTKEFYTEIQNWYAWALKESKFPGGKLEENLIRLLTRIIFVWFLKEKKLVPDKIFDPEFLKDIVKDFGRRDYYYNTVLQNLFFATLNKKPEERRFAKFSTSKERFFKHRDEFGVKNLFRYQDKILISEKEFLEIFKDTPFINGGLFECLDSDGDYIDGFSREEKKRAKLPDYLFFSEEHEEDLSHFYGTPTKRKVRGLIDILKGYNFTADENSPIDVEVSLDPELLGHIFENLLAAYNPETQISARKAIGSYYTPKEIVEYMVDEALFYYFKTATNLKGELIRKLLSYEEENEREKFKFGEKERKEIVDAIDRLKIIDPAVGSGAFPMGILHKLVHLLNKVDPGNILWKEKQMKRLLMEIEGLLKIETKEEREKLFRELREIFDENMNYPDYARKVYLIENSIYGVDIQPIAIQICKLRFFLSLLVDQKIERERENFGIRPLPHLETKFVAANTLIGFKKGGQLSLSFEDSEITKLKTELKNLYKKHFNIKNRSEKNRLQEKAKKIRERIKELLLQKGWATEEARKLAEFDIFDQTASADWFDPEWMLGVEGGFDIVIANPPYISTKGIDSKYKKILKEQYSFADDLYNHFYFKGFQLLKEKGILSYISSKTFWTIQTKQNLRQLLLKNRILKIVDTANPFLSAMVDTGIIIAKKEKNTNENYTITFLDFNKQKEYKVSMEVYKNIVNNVFFEPDEFNMKVYKKFGKKVKELMDNWWEKISTSKNIKKYERELKKYRETLKEGDITLLGLITEGGVGLQTGDNGKYIGVLEETKYAEKVKKERPEKLWKFIQTKQPEELKFLKSKDEVKEYINSLTEEEIRELFDSLKEKYGRDIFGQGWLYRIVRKWEVADVNSLTEEEKLNGISGNRTFVPYDKGDKEGNRWYAPTPYYIDWSKANVKKLQTDPKARWQGYQFYFREGFCWNFALLPKLEDSMYIKCRIKEKSVNDVMSMSLYLSTKLHTNKSLVSLLNSRFLYNYLKTFINSTAGQQINDFRQLPIIIPTLKQLKKLEDIFNRAYTIQKNKFEGKITEKEAGKKLDEIQKELDKKVLRLYGLSN